MQLNHTLPPVARRWILLGIIVATIMSSLDTSIVNVGLPTIVKDLHTTFAQAQWVVLSYMLVVTSLIVGMGRFGDLFGKKHLYLWGIALFTLASLLCGIAPTIEALIGLRAVQGAGAAIMMALSFALVGDIFPREEMGRVIGLLSGMVALGIGMGPALGGVLIGIIGWPALFLVNVPFGLIACFILWRFLPSSGRQSSRTRFDWPGLLVLAGTLFCYALAMTEAESSGFASPSTISLLVGSLIGLTLLIWIEQHTAAPLLPLDLFRNVLLSGSLLISVLVYTVAMSVILLLPFFLTNGAHLSAIVVGVLISVGPLITAVLSVPAGWLADRFGSRTAIAVGLLLMTLGCLLMSTIRVSDGIAGFIIRLAVINTGMALFQTNNNAAVMGAAQASQRGVASGLLSLSRTLGITTGASFMGAIFDALVMQAAKSPGGINAVQPHAIELGVQGTFQVAVGILAVALVCLFSIGWLQRKQQADVTTQEQSVEKTTLPLS